MKVRPKPVALIIINHTHSRFLIRVYCVFDVGAEDEQLKQFLLNTRPSVIVVGVDGPPNGVECRRLSARISDILEEIREDDDARMKREEEGSSSSKNRKLRSDNDDEDNNGASVFPHRTHLTFMDASVAQIYQHSRRAKAVRFII